MRNIAFTPTAFGQFNDWRSINKKYRIVSLNYWKKFKEILSKELVNQNLLNTILKGVGREG